ncbi:MAG: 10 kDa chaperonin 3 [Porticoccaceae bacterium]|nr:MAG: 10 kDa chaperonin 3 [Porticoccaceae bacterium]
MTIKPLYDRVVVRRIDAEQKSKGGIIIPDTAKEKPTQGEVIAVGEGALLDDGTLRPLRVKVGDRVLFAKYAGTEIEQGDDTLLVMRESDILAVIEETDAKEKAA